MITEFLTRAKHAAQILVQGIPVGTHNHAPQKRAETLTFEQGLFPEDAIPRLKTEIQACYENNLPSPTANAAILELLKLDTGEFPVLRDEKIRNDDFVNIKMEYIDAAFDAIKDYYQYLIHLPPISRNPNFSGAIQYIVRGFISIFWDMPSSKHHHDNEPFGQLRHCLLVACQEAERMSRHNIFGKSGIDSEQTRKQRPYIVMAAFIAGLFSDSNKLLNYSLKARLGAGERVYSPFKGSASILEFKLKSPKNSLMEDWSQNHFPNMNFGLHLFYLIVPQELRQAFSGELYEYIYTSIQFYKSSADHLATRSALEAQNYLDKIASCCKELIHQTSAVNHPSGWAFKLCADWYLVDYTPFINALAHRMNAVGDSVASVLYDNALLFGKGSPREYTLKLYIYHEGKRKPITRNMGFIPAAFFDRILAEMGTPAPIPRYKIWILESQQEYLRGLGIDLPSYAFKVLKDDGSGSEDKEEPATQAGTSGGGQEAQPTASGDKPAAPSNPSDTGTTAAQTLPADTDAVKEENGAQASQEPHKTPNVEPDAAEPGPDKNTMPVLQSFTEHLTPLKGKMSEEFFNEAHNLPRAIGEAVANALGINMAKVIDPRHIQATASDKTLFYLLQSRALYARSPQVLSLGWDLFLTEMDAGLHQWAKRIRDLPPAFTGNNVFSKHILNFIFSAWMDMGILLPREFRNKKWWRFQENDLPVTLLTGFRNKEPQCQPTQIKGWFIELNPDALKNLATHRHGKGPLTDVLNNIYAAAYGDSAPTPTLHIER